MRCIRTAHNPPCNIANLDQAAHVIHKKLTTTSTCTRRSGATVIGDQEKQPIVVPSQDLAAAQKQHRENYAIELEEKERAEGLANNPSVDPETQRAIVLEYRDLHQQIKDEGLYKCNYANYGRECIRYGSLFAIFMYLLHIKWYLSSSVFLGLFWVC